MLATNDKFLHLSNPIPTLPVAGGPFSSCGGQHPNRGWTSQPRMEPLTRGENPPPASSPTAVGPRPQGWMGGKGPSAQPRLIGFMRVGHNPTSDSWVSESEAAGNPANSSAFQPAKKFSPNSSRLEFYLRSPAGWKSEDRVQPAGIYNRMSSGSSRFIAVFPPTYSRKSAVSSRFLPIPPRFSWNATFRRSSESRGILRGCRAVLHRVWFVRAIFSL